MRKKPLLTTVQLMFLIVGSALIFPYTFMPILTTPPANQDAWITLLMSLFYIIILSAPLLFIINRFRGVNTNQTIEMVLGDKVGRVMTLFFILFFFFCETACLMISGQFIKIYLTPDTPLWALLLFITVPVCYASYKGAGTIGRLAPFFVSFLMLSIILFFIFGIDKIDLNELRPVAADSSFLALNEGAFLTATRYSEILIFFVFAYYIKRQASIIKTFAVSLAIFAVFFMLMLIPVLTVLGSEYAKHIWSAYYIFSRQVEMFDFLERVQALNVLAWFPCSILKLSIYNYMASQVFSGMVRAKTHRYFVIPLAFAAYFICLLPVMGKTETFEFLTSDRVFPFILLPVVFILPFIILAIYIMRRKKIKYHLGKQIQLNDDLAK